MATSMDGSEGDGSSSSNGVASPLEAAIKRTETAFTSFLSPRGTALLTRKSLQRPPFKFLKRLVDAVQADTGFATDLYSAPPPHVSVCLLV